MANSGTTKKSQKLPMHHSYASQTQDSYRGESSKSYTDGAKRGGGKGAASDPDGPAPASGPKKQTY